ncbi:SRPBCC family protein [Ciceribacter ferrooxidans]|uniref:SRPBCC domain-containing protein n=1 Tax=Ciceribacter ferrooxidans TaxID=2509717 RepID=A0A4V1RLZ3_9HYPH|nr:SRPBCC domain-containing protein [Ciceribacter ferrooxidans]RYB97892.1 SRPBCC domain-containing protein [Ciceribacter ferrooxidans]
MTDAAMISSLQQIVVDEIFPHAPQVIWRALTTGEMIARWLMQPSGFEAVVGNQFTYQTKPAGAWDGTIHCEVLEVQENVRFAYAWRGGDDSNEGYGSRLDTVVTWTLESVAEGTRVRLVHSGFELPKNEVAFRNMGDGWKVVVPRLKATIRQAD